MIYEYQILNPWVLAPLQPPLTTPRLFFTVQSDLARRDGYGPTTMRFTVMSTSGLPAAATTTVGERGSPLEARDVARAGGAPPDDTSGDAQDLDVAAEPCRRASERAEGAPPPVAPRASAAPRRDPRHAHFSHPPATPTVLLEAGARAPASPL